MKIALITLCDQGAHIVSQLHAALPEASCFVHEIVAAKWEGERFKRVVALTEQIFNQFDGLVYVAPCGAAVRSIAGKLAHKKKDPAVVVVDVGGRHAISLLSGHEGGANDLALSVSNIIGAEPVISTTSEAARNIIVGLGCRKDTAADKLVTAICDALHRVNLAPEHVRLLATAEIKQHEPGLREAAERLGLPLRIISNDEIGNCPKHFQETPAARRNVDLPAVAEPAALLAGRRTSLLLHKTKYEGITVAIAKENCPSLALDQGTR